MFRHYLIAAFRSMAANRLLSAIAILGLAVGIVAALLMGLVVRNQMTFDHFIPGHERTYAAIRGGLEERPAGVCNRRGACWLDDSLLPLLRLKVPGIEDITRLVHTHGVPVKLARGTVGGWEELYWADANAFDLVPVPVLHGELETALARPDGIVLPRALAEKYFGRANAVGGILTVDGQPMTVRAVIKDLPANGTTLRSGIFVSGQARSSRLTPQLSALFYLRLKPGASVAAVNQQISDLNWSLNSEADKAELIKAGARDDYRVALLPLGRINLHGAFNPGISLRLPVAIAAGLLVLFIAGVNFVNLMVARAARREREVGVRKACGADRATLVVQFLGEAMIAVALAGCIALALSEWLLPVLNAFLDTGARLSYSGDAVLLPALLAAVVLLGLATGAYPALILSSFRPAGILRGRTGGAGLVRNILVTLQFVILIVLAIAAAVIWRQHDFATREALRIDTDQMLVIRATRPTPVRFANMAEPAACPVGFRDALGKLPGVLGALCSGPSFLDGLSGFGWIRAGGGSQDFVRQNLIDARLLSLYGVKPLAGSLPPASGPSATETGTIINVSALKMLGFSSAQAAIGQSWLTPVMPRDTREMGGKLWGQHNVITAVVPDFSFVSLGTSEFEERMGAVYSPWMAAGRSSALLIHVKLDGQRIPETLAAIDRLWATTNQYGPLDRFFVSDYMQALYRDTRRQAQFLAACAAITILLACLGLVGIAVSSADRRTKEIGVRKAMGARNWQVTALLLWQFSRPVLAASVIAWPIAFWLMQRWLAGFAYHIVLQWWFFAAASGAALLLALLTVAGQAIGTARQKPVLALRYE